MARIILREKETHNTILGDIPVYAYGIEADTYEEAYTTAKAAFDRDLHIDIEEQLMHALENPAPYEIDW